MMDLDMVSNCSSLSLQSEEIRSNVSTFSGLSMYQDEFAELHDLVNPIKYSAYSRCSTPKQDSGCGLQYEESVTVSAVSQHLQDSEKIQEKYKFDLYNIEKNIELKYYDKIEKLLKTNHMLQSELDSANEQIARLLKNYLSKQNSSSLLDMNFIELEKKYHNVTLKYSELQRDYFQNKNQKEEYETENKQLKIGLSELKIDIQAKNGCVKECKNKISRQYVEIETLQKNNIEILQNINETNIELSHVRRTLDWYKQRLRSCQNEKQILSDEILKCKRDLCSQRESTEILNVELSKWRAKCEIIELRALKDKEKLSEQLDSIILANGFKDNHLDLNVIQSEDSNAYIINHYETSIQDLTLEITKIKRHVQEQDDIVQRITKENSDLIAHCITLQKTIQHNENTIEELEDVKKHFTRELNEMKSEAKHKLDELIQRENKIFILQTELRFKKDEQQVIEQTVKTIREQFKVFKSKHKELEDELFVKNKQILQMENEKQKLFMENNWNICELQKLKEKDMIIHQLKDEITTNNETLNKYLVTINEIQQKNADVVNENQSNIQNNNLRIHKYEHALTEYRIMVTNYEKQIIDLQQLLNESNMKASSLKNSVKVLKNELNQKDSLSAMNKCISLEGQDKYNQSVLNTKISNSSNENNDVKKMDKNNSNFHLQKSENCTEIYYATLVLKQNESTLQDNFPNVVYNKPVEEKSMSNIPNLKKRLLLKISALEDRIEKLSEACHECFTKLSIISDMVKDDMGKEELQKLRVSLQVKELELKEKQKKYEANNRTLLRKVKEHMRGRNIAEKHNKYLQEMYNSLVDDNNDLKLEVKSKEGDIENIKKILDKFTNINEKLKLSILKPEQANKNRTCDICNSHNEKIISLEKCINELEDGKLACQNVLMDKEDIIVTLQNEVQNLREENVLLSKFKKEIEDESNNFIQDKDILTSTIKALEDDIRNRESYVDELNIMLKQEKKQFSETVLENSRLKNCINELNTQVEYLSDEVKILSSRLQIKSEELNQLEDEKCKSEKNFLEKEKDFQEIIATLKHYVHDMQLEMTSINNEKYFLQRLCSDLKLALKSHVSHNKVLQQQLNVFSKETDFNSLPNMLPNLPCDIKYDDNYINQLLQQNKAPLQSKPITEIKSGLDTLKREILTLQEQIARKNIPY